MDHDEEEEEEEEIVGSLLSSLENILLRGTNASHEKQRNQSEKDLLLSRHASLAYETFENAGRRGYLSGHLTKLGNVYKTWRQRFFILNDAKRLLFYYEDAKNARVKGAIELAGADVLRDVTRGKDLCFQISYPRHSHRRRFVLYAENQRDLQLWLKALNHVAQHGTPSAGDTGQASSPTLIASARRSMQQGTKQRKAMRGNRTTSLSPQSSPVPLGDHLRRSRSVSATSPGPPPNGCECIATTATVALHGSLHPLQAASRVSLSSTDLPHAIAQEDEEDEEDVEEEEEEEEEGQDQKQDQQPPLPPPHREQGERETDSPGAIRRASLPILPSEHGGNPARTAITHLRSLIAFLPSRSFSLLPLGPLAPHPHQHHHRQDQDQEDKEENQDEDQQQQQQQQKHQADAATECDAPAPWGAGRPQGALDSPAVLLGSDQARSAVIGECLSSIAVHVDASLRTRSTDVVMEEDALPNDTLPPVDSQASVPNYDGDVSSDGRVGTLPVMRAPPDYHDPLRQWPPQQQQQQQQQQQHWACPASDKTESEAESKGRTYPAARQSAGPNMSGEDENEEEEEEEEKQKRASTRHHEHEHEHAGEADNGGDLKADDDDTHIAEKEDVEESTEERQLNDNDDEEEEEEEPQRGASSPEDLAARFRWLVDENRAKVLAQVEPHGAETNGWTLVREEANVLVSRKEMKDTSLIMTRAEGRIRARASRVLGLIASFQYDPLVLSCERIKEVTKGVDIAHLRARSPFPLLSNRDFVLLRSGHRDPETGIYLACATSIPELPWSSLPRKDGEGEGSAFVRGEVVNSGWAVEPFEEEDAHAATTSEEQVYCTYVVCVDLKGLVPNWVVNMFQARDVHAAFARLRQLAEAPYHTEEMP